jgi:hypothetical protein
MLATTAFDQGQMPAITGILQIPSLRAWGIIRFLIDTGASNILLQPHDGRNIKVPYGNISFTAGPQGIGASQAGAYSASAEVTFTDGQYRYSYDVLVDILDPNTAKSLNPTLLGRSILHQWRIVYDHPNQILDIEPTQPCRRTLGS